MHYFLKFYIKYTLIKKKKKNRYIALINIFRIEF